MMAQMISAEFSKIEDAQFRNCMMNRNHLIAAELRTACHSSVVAGMETGDEALNRIGLQWGRHCRR